MKKYSLFDEIFVDNFAGGGGASTGIAKAIGRSVDIAINHDPAAIAMHRSNHPYTDHYCESVWEVDPRVITGGRPVGLAWFSPDCKDHSKAKGGRPVDKNIRGLAWVALRWAATVGPRVIILENVEEFAQWGPLIAKRDPETGRMLKVIHSENEEEYQIVVAEPSEIVPPKQRFIIPDPKKRGRIFNTFINALRRQKYDVEYRELRACDYGAPTSRNRFFLQARRDGRPIVWPEPTHGDPNSEAVKRGKLKPWRTAAEIIDWSLPCPSIFERKRPLAENTMRRIARGLLKFVINNPDPFIIKINHHGAEFRGQNINEPLRTITAKNGWGIVTPIIGRQFGKSIGHQIDSPLATITAGGGGKSQLVAAFLAKHYGGNYKGSGTGMNSPVSTITTVDHNALVATFLSKYHGATSDTDTRGQLLDEPIRTIDAANRFALVTNHLIKMKGTNIGQPVTEPIQTITAGGLHFGEVRAFLLKYYGTATGQKVDEPIHTITTKDRLGLVTIHGEDYQVVDICMRMLKPRELFRGQGFDDSYIIDHDCDGNKFTQADQVARCGNAVPPQFAEALVRANLPEHCVRRDKRKMA